MFNILFVDNDATIRMIAKKSIESHWDCKVLLAVNGAEGVKMALKERPKLILLDVLMPGLDGVQTLLKLREQGIEAPVIFVTAKEELSELEAHKDKGVISVLKKPFQPRELLTECAKILGQPN